VQSTFLWGYSRLGAEQIMPKLDDAARKRAARAHYLVLLSEKARPIRAGAKALCRAGLDFEPLTHKVLRGDVVDLYYTVFERHEPNRCNPGVPA
jgi:hypothetical protein